jgi:hypothetical protein
VLLDAEVPSEAARIDFVWLNWCGEPGPYAFQVTTSAGDQFHDSNLAPPPCADAAQPSKLGQATPEPAPDIPTCTTQDYHLETDGAASADGSVQLAVKTISLGVPCFLDTSVAVALTDGAGQALDIEGNGLTLRLIGDLRGVGLGTGAIWANWCGEADDAQIELNDFTGSVSGFGPIGVPTCDAPGEPSTLRAMTPEELGSARPVSSRVKSRSPSRVATANRSTFRATPRSYRTVSMSPKGRRTWLRSAGRTGAARTARSSLSCKRLT